MVHACRHPTHNHSWVGIVPAPAGGCGRPGGLQAGGNTLPTRRRAHAFKRGPDRRVCAARTPPPLPHPPTPHTHTCSMRTAHTESASAADAKTTTLRSSDAYASALTASYRGTYCSGNMIMVECVWRLSRSMREKQRGARGQSKAKKHAKPNLASCARGWRTLLLSKPPPAPPPSRVPVRGTASEGRHGGQWGGRV